MRYRASRVNSTLRQHFSTFMFERANRTRLCHWRRNQITAPHPLSTQVRKFFWGSRWCGSESGSLFPHWRGSGSGFRKLSVFLTDLQWKNSEVKVFCQRQSKSHIWEGLGEIYFVVQKDSNFLVVLFIDDFKEQEGNYTARLLALKYLLIA